MAAAKTITPGDRFGRWAVLEATRYKVYPNKTRILFHECRCDCGTIQFVSIYKLHTGHSQSCGCLQVERASKASITHGRSKSRVYRIWSCIITRCTNPKAINYERYGGRGITVCERWRKFENFFEDMGEPPPGLTIDRTDNDGPYCKDNCAWRTASEQAKNRRSRRKRLTS
jgi:hypothetical protein